MTTTTQIAANLTVAMALALVRRVHEQDGVERQKPRRRKLDDGRRQDGQQLGRDLEEWINGWPYAPSEGRTLASVYQAIELETGT